MRLFPALFPALNRPMKAWHGKTVWIVGASSGIGEATAAALHALGARVIVSARQAQTLGAFEIHFPKRFTLWMQTLRLLPDRVFFFLVQRVTQ